MLSSRIKWFRVPVIFLSALGSVFGIGLSPYLPQLMISEICSAMSLVVGLIGSIELFLAISTKMESELVQSKELYLLAIEIQKTLLLDMENRNGDGMAYLEDKFNVYSKLIENSYLLECKIMDELTPLPNEFQSKISANHSWENTPRKLSIVSNRKKKSILDIHMMKRPHRVAPISPPLPISPSPLSSDTNIIVNPPPPIPTKPTPVSVPDDLPRPMIRRRGSNPTVASRRSLVRLVSSEPPVSVPDDVPRPMSMQRRGSNPTVASRRSIVRLVSSEPPPNPIVVPPLNFAQLDVHPRRRRSSIKPLHNENQGYSYASDLVSNTGEKESRRLFGQQPIRSCDDNRIKSILPEYQESNPPSPIRRCATSESKPKSKIPPTSSFIDLRKEGRHENIPSFHSRHRCHSFEFIPPPDHIPPDQYEQARIQHALMAMTPYISENPSPDHSIH